METTGKSSLKPYHCSGCGQKRKSKQTTEGTVTPFVKFIRLKRFGFVTNRAPGYEKPEPWSLIEIICHTQN